MNKLFERRSKVALGYDEFFELSSVEPNIRTIIDQETTGIIFERRLPINVICRKNGSNRRSPNASGWSFL